MKNLSNPTIAAFLCLTALLSATPSSAQLELRSNRSLAEALSKQPEPLPLSQRTQVSNTSQGVFAATYIEPGELNNQTFSVSYKMHHSCFEKLQAHTLIQLF